MAEGRRTINTDIEKFLSSENYKYKINEPLSKHTTLGIGGDALFFVEVETEDKLVSLLNFVKENKIPFYIIGGGTNILFSDDGFDGIIIKLAIRNEQLEIDNNVLECVAGEFLSVVAKQTAEQGLSGLEYFVGIPGTVGGAIFGNAGVKEHAISDNLIKIKIIDFDGNKKFLDRKDINFQYRKSGLENCVITRAFFKLKKAAKNGILDAIFQELEKRKNSQPQGVKSAGCVFKNPAGDSAGRLIDSLNLKNYNIGEIEVSSKHANFFINKSNGTAKDMSALIEFVKKKVFEKYNIELETEIRIIKR